MNGLSRMKTRKNLRLIPRCLHSPWVNGGAISYNEKISEMSIFVGQRWGVIEFYFGHILYAYLMTEVKM